MDFCVKCGKKQLYEDFLCKECYLSEHPQAEKKEKKRKQPEIQHAAYFEATLQLRFVDQHVVNFVYEDIEKKGISATREKFEQNGLDVSVDSKKYAQQLGKALQEKFGGLLKTTARIFTRDRQSSKDVYRVTVLFKQFPYKKGDTFEMKGKKYTVKNASRDVIVEDPDHKMIKMRYTDLERAHIF